MSPHPLDHNLPSASIYKRRGEVMPIWKKPVKEFFRNIGRGIDKNWKKLFWKQNREQEDLRNRYQRDKASACSQCHEQTNAMRQEMTNSAPAAYAQTAPVQSPSAPSAQYPSTTAAPSASPSPSPTPSTETTTSIPVSPGNTTTETPDYVAGQASAPQSQRETKYPSAEWPTNLWKWPDGIWVSGLPGKDNPATLKQQYQSLKNAWVTTVFSIIDDGIDAAHQSAAQSVWLRIEKVSIYQADKIAGAIGRWEQCLVHCRWGQHRAPTTVANAYLIAGKTSNIDEAFRMAWGRLENFFWGAEGQVYPEGQEELAKLVAEAKKKGISVEGSEIVNRLRSAGQRV